MAQHGRGLDVSTAGRAGAQRQEEPMLAAVGTRNAETRVRDNGSASTLPPPDLGLPAASRRTEAPPVAPAGNDQGRDGWLSDLLNRTDANQGAPTGREAPRGRATPAQQPQPQAPQASSNPLESLSLDIGRLMDRNLAAEMWDRYQRGENKAFTKRLYTPAGQKALTRSPASTAPTATSKAPSTATSPSSNACSTKSPATAAVRRSCATT